MGKFVLITDALEDPRVQKRKKLLEANGHTVSIYGFKRGELRVNSKDLADAVIGDIGDLPYFKRLRILHNGIKSVLEIYRQEETVTYYLFGLQVAIIYSLLCNRPYIYEEADLVHTYFNNPFLKKWFERQDKKIINNSLL